MGLFGRLFGRKRDEFDELAEKELAAKDFGSPEIPAELGLGPEPDLGEKSPFPSPLPEEHESFPSGSLPSGATPSYPSGARQAAFPSVAAGTKDRDLELISSKLDTVKAILASLDQRMANLEKVAGTGKKEERLW
ncbi:MAG: hypothetical protein AB1668_05565 [Nanoarchaeota archaeon]